MGLKRASSFPSGIHVNLINQISSYYVQNLKENSSSNEKIKVSPSVVV